ncbi:MAG: hypothetical protein ABSB09_16195 [Acidimicrobiales bacterium]
MSRKVKQERPSLASVLVKIDRAESHLRFLEADVERVFPGHRYVIEPEIYDEGRRHVFKAQHPPEIPPDWSLVVGDMFHNLRSSLDYLAYQLVLCCGGTPNTKTNFPIRDRPYIRRNWWRPWKEQRILPTISGGIGRDVREILEAVQPYHGPKRNHGLDLLRHLDNVDKHRRLVIIAVATTNSISSAISGDPMEPPPSTTVFTRRPFEHDEVIAIVNYERPYPQPDPNLYFIPDIAFGERDRRIFQDPLRVVTGDLFYLVRDQVVPLFEGFFPIP